MAQCWHCLGFLTRAPQRATTPWPHSTDALVPSAWLSWWQTGQKLQSHLPNRQRMKQQMPNKAVGLIPFTQIIQAQLRSFWRTLPPKRPCGGWVSWEGPWLRHGRTKSRCGRYSWAGGGVPTLWRMDALCGWGVEHCRRCTWPSCPRFLLLAPLRSE